LPELGFEPSGVASLQALTARPTAEPRDDAGSGQPLDTEGEEYLGVLLRRLANLHAGRRLPTSIERIEDLLASYLKAVDSELIVQAASALGEDLARWSPNMAPPRALARLLLRVGLLESIPVLRGLPLEPPQFEHVSRLLATTWINCRAVEPIER